MIYLLIFIATLGLILILTKLLMVGSILAAFPITQGAMFHPTASVRIKTVLDVVPMSKDEFFVDLGCGDGRVLVGAAKRYGVCALGYEVNPLAYALAKVKTIGNKKVKVKFGNFWQKNLGDADVVFCYLFPDVMGKLAEKLSQELRPGTRVISCNFPLPGWKEEQVLYPPSARHGDPIYVYRFPNLSVSRT